MRIFGPVMQLKSVDYNVFFEGDDFSYLEEFLHENFFSSIFILCDDKTRKYCLPDFLKENGSLKAAKVFTIPSGEKNKTLTKLASVWNFLMLSGADRHSLLICLGGGVVCDLGGFAASTFKRGIHFIHVPTTLLGMADASVGGKTGVDYKGYKNIIGTITQPMGVFVQGDFLDTLTDRHIDNGLAEIIKAALVGDEGLWRKFLKQKKLPQTKLTAFIQASVKVKNAIVIKDPHEKNLRKVLNFGHTAGHAIESYFLNKKKIILHGEAVVMGMCVELCLGKILKRTDAKTALRTFLYLKKNFAVKKFSTKEISAFLRLMRQDKKNQSGRFSFALIERPGKAIINVQASPEEVKQAFVLYNNLLK